MMNLRPGLCLVVPALAAGAQETPRGMELYGLSLRQESLRLQGAKDPTLPPIPPSLDRLGRVLAEHPDHGEARLARLEWALALRQQILPYGGVGPIAPSWLRRVDPRLYIPLEEAWAAFRKVPGWPGQVDLDRPTLGRLLWGALPAEEWASVARELVAALKEDPAHPRLQANLALAHRQLSREDVERLAGEWEALEPLPGQAWPPLPLLRAHLDRMLRLERYGEVRYKAGAWSRKVDRLFSSRAAWRDQVYREALLLTYGALAESFQDGSPASIRAALQRLREASGAAWSELGPLFQARAHLPADPDFLREVAQFVDQPALPDPPMPAPIPPWRLVVRDPARLPGLKAAFDGTPKLQTWLPSELTFATDPDQAPALQGWVGDVSRAAFPAWPDGDTLAEGLAAGRRGRLRLAFQAVEKAPEHPGPRRFRIPLLLARGPLRGLEEALAEDLRILRELPDPALPPGDPNLWFFEAQRAIPDLEAHLARWPLDGAAWEALAFWTSCMPRHGGPALAAGAQPAFGPGLPFQLGLPAQVHDRIGAQLARHQAWAQGRAWFEPVWEALRSATREDLRRRPWLAALESEVRHHLGRAYLALGQEGLARQLREASLFRGHGTE